MSGTGGTAHAYDIQGSPDTSPPVLRIQLLGGFRAERTDGVQPAERWPRPSARTLVKLLALAPGHQLHREHIMAACWPHAELPAAQRSLRVAVHTARHALEPELTPRSASSYLVADGALLRLAPGAVQVDTDRARSLAESALIEGDAPQLAAALAAFTGELLPEDRYAPWAEPHRTRLAELRDRVVLALAEAQLAAGEAQEACGSARLLLESAPADERAHRVLIRAWLRQGMRRAAIRQYELCAQALDAADPGARPGPETAGLHRAALDRPAEPEADAARVRVALARTLERSGRYAEAIRVLREALTAYELQRGADACTLTATRLAEILAHTATPQEARTVLDAHPPGPDAAADVRAAHRMAESMILFHEGRYAAGLAAARGAQAVLGPDADGTLLARCLSQQAICHGLLGCHEAAIAPAEQALAPAEESGDPALLATVLSVLRENARRAGLHRKALGHGRRALALAEQAGRPTATAFERANLAEIHLLLGEVDEAEQLADAAVGLAEPFGGTVLAFALTALARVRTAADPDRARALLDRAERCAADGGHQQAVDEVRAARAELAARTG
ncbi:AfsR/SARP family transcriptional regulator [Streptomyces durmitorensis]|uniref:AfsR/SARP family transcriptional regulator n=1 Tax=Streptomyces durmitorensis TaxID=319947 RepID=UPI0024BD6424|nr:BTAD domain-containing putative transcriptional regulator [Streptomyces durmitorensis]